MSTAPVAGPAAATLSRREHANLTSLVNDIRAGVHRLSPAGNPLDVLAAAEVVPCFRDLYYILANEDPLDAMPARRLLGDWALGPRHVVPVLLALGASPAAAAQPRRWAPTLYHALRLLSMLALPVESANATLASGCNLEVAIVDLKHALASSPAALAPFVALLQYYLEKKAVAAEALAPAADAKVTDARIENILRFFRSLFLPPRPTVGADTLARDRGIHTALVGACVRADLFATVALPFMERDEARALPTHVVLLTAQVYALAFRCSTPRALAADAARGVRRRRRVASGVNNDEQAEKDAGADVAVPKAAPRLPAAAALASATVHRKGSRLRHALTRERTFVGGGRSVTAAAGWSTRHSGSFHVAARQKAGAGAGGGVVYARNPAGRALAAPTAQRMIAKKIVSVRGMTKSHKTGSARGGVHGVLHEGLAFNSRLLRMLCERKRALIAVGSGKAVGQRQMRADLVDSGRVALAELVKDFIADCFPALLSELRERVEEGRRDNPEDWAGRRAFFVLAATAAGFQREYAEMTAPVEKENGDAMALLSSSRATIQNAPLAATLKSGSGKAVAENVDWKAVEEGISVASFTLVFEAVNEARAEKTLSSELESGTTAMKEMMKLLQCMSTIDGPEVVEPKKPAAEAGFGTDGGDGEADATTEPATSPIPHRAPLPVVTITMKRKEKLAEEGDQGASDVVDAGASLVAVESDAIAVVPDAAPGQVDADDIGEAEVPAMEKAGDDENAVVPFPFASKLTPREIALNTLEELFETQLFLDTPSSLTKEFDSKVHSCTHLANTIEIAFTFTATLLGDSFTNITVKRKKKKKKAAKTKVEPKLEEDDEKLDLRAGGSESESGNENEPEKSGVANEKSNTLSDNALAPEGSQSGKDVNSNLAVAELDVVASPTAYDERDESEADFLASDSEAGVENDSDTEAQVISRSGAVGAIETVPLANDAVIERRKRAAGKVIGSPKIAAGEVVEPPKIAAREDLEPQMNAAGGVSEFAAKTNLQSEDKTTTNATVSEGANMSESELLASDTDAVAENESAVNSQMNNRSDGDGAIETASPGDSADIEPQNNTAPEIAADPAETSPKWEYNRPDAYEDDLEENLSSTDPAEISSKWEYNRPAASEDEMEEKLFTDEDSEEDMEGVIIEGADVIRGFASPKALQHLALAIRVSLCNTSGIVGSIMPTPEGSGELSALPIVAKSLVVLQSVWKVVGDRERGAFRCSYYTYATLHLLCMAVVAAEKGKVPDSSILGTLSDFGREVLSEFYDIFSVNPALLMDSMFLSDIGTMRAYSSKMHEKACMEEEKRALELDELRGINQASSKDDEKVERKKKKKRKSASRRDLMEKLAASREKKMGGRRVRAGSSEEDLMDDADLDNLDIVRGGADSNSSDSTERRASGSGKRQRVVRRRIADDIADRVSSGSSSDSDINNDALAQLKKKKPKKLRKLSKLTEKAPAATKHRQQFSSSDEYSSDAVDGAAAPSSGDRAGAEAALSSPKPMSTAAILAVKGDREVGLSDEDSSAMDDDDLLESLRLSKTATGITAMKPAVTEADAESAAGSGSESPKLKTPVGEVKETSAPSSAKLPEESPVTAESGGEATATRTRRIVFDSSDDDSE